MGYGSEWQHDQKQIDWDGVKMSAPKPPAPGLYELKFVEMQVTETSGKDKQGKPKDKAAMIKARLEIVAARDSAGEEDIGRTVFDNWVFSQEGAFKVKNAAVVSGKELPSSLSYDDLAAFASSFEGEVITAMVDNRTYEGKTNPNIRYYGEEAPKDDENGNGAESHPPRAANKPNGNKGKVAPRRGR